MDNAGKVGPSLASSALRLLLVDDEPILREELQEFLTEKGLDVASAGSGAAALRMLAADPAITVVLTDIRMPAMDGLDLATRILQSRGEADAIEVVLMTGHGSIDSAIAGVRAGVFDFLRKPMDLRLVAGVVARAHARAAGRRAAKARQMAEVAGLRADYAALQARYAQSTGRFDPDQGTPPELAKVLSHELRTPLIPLLAMPDLLGDPKSLSAAELNGYLHDVANAGERLRSIADDLIEFLAPPNAARIGRRAVPAGTLLAAAVACCQAQADRAGVMLRCDEGSTGPVLTDAASAGEALRRLVENAVTASRPGDEVVLSAREQGGMVALAVRDHGAGMTPAQLHTALLPFHQVDMSLTRRSGGLGLGLPLAERAARRLGGAMRLESTPDQGTVATMLLPLAPGGSAP